MQKLEEKEILFIPDQYLGQYVSIGTGRGMVLWPGFCPTHARIRAEDILRLKREYPQAEVMVHPECRLEVVEVADVVKSTSGMIRHASQTKVKEIILGTEVGIIYRMRKENPDKKFIPLSEQAVCPTMKMITLESVLRCLEEMSPHVAVSEEIRLKAQAAVDRMLQVG